MLTLEKIREIDPELASLSDTELEELRNVLYETAQVAFDIWWYRKSGSKYPTGLLPSTEVSEKI